MKYKEYQFSDMYNRLPPLDFYNDYTKQLEEWQIKALKIIDGNKNLLICAKTSMGKTWLAMYPPLIGKKTLFIVPTKPLAYQVTAVFKKFLNGKTSILVKDYHSINNDDLVFVGTPNEIEKNLPNMNINLDFIVCDEIHNLNNYDGDCYERLIKLFTPKIQFLALSATVGNANELKYWFSNVSNTNVNLIEYSKRFLNHQRYLWTNKLEKVHPFSCLEFENINEDFLQKNLPFTPKDNIEIYNVLKKELGKENVKDINLETIFPEDNKRLSLDDSKMYEDVLKQKILNLKKENPNMLKNILKKFENNKILEESVNIYNLFKQIKSNKMTPCILFQLNSNYCKDIFKQIVYYLEKIENLNHPYYYDNIEFLHEYYLKYNEKLTKFKQNIKLNKDDGSKGHVTKEDQKNQIIKNFEDTEFTIYINEIKNRIEKQKKNIINNESITDKIRCIQLKNLDKSLNELCNVSVIKDYDQFEKHIDFCMNELQPMTADVIREIKRKITSNLNITVEYTNEFIQGLKRGIGIYTEDMPEIYNQIVQSLVQEKKLGFVISDKTLGLGINMPIRTTCIFGYKDYNVFTKNDYEQFIGRAGRRGLDVEGNIIYCNTDWKKLMKGDLGIIIGQDNINYKYNVLSEISRFQIKDTQRVFEKLLNYNIKIDTDKIEKEFYQDKLENIILWNLKEYKDKTSLWIYNHDKLNMVYKKTIKKDDLINFLRILIFIFKLNNTSCLDIQHNNITLNTYFDEFITIYKSENFTSDDSIKLIYELINILQELYNIYNQDDIYDNIKNMIKFLFDDMRIKINRNQCLN